MEIYNKQTKTIVVPFIFIFIALCTSACAKLPTIKSKTIDFNKNNAPALVQDIRDYAVLVAKTNIRRYGSFNPFGIALSAKGEYQIISGHGKNAQQDLNMLIESYRRLASKKSIVAAAIVYDTELRLTDKSEPINAIYTIIDSKHTASHSGYTLYQQVKPGRYYFKPFANYSLNQTVLFKRLMPNLADNKTKNSY